MGHLIPEGTGLPELLALAALAAVLAKVINNLPAVLVLLPLTAPSGPGWACASNWRSRSAGRGRAPGRP
ncbi:hypothetical protein [Streptomyces sp. NPDC050848]|uniref:hypothetical protein n=1 Tax=Streptomyces sp. NPDC050848 TaxID=3155791 RepID=UPI0033F03DFB